MYVHMAEFTESDANRGQKKLLDPSTLELQATVCSLMKVWQLKSDPPEEQYRGCTLVSHSSVCKYDDFI